LSVLDAWRAYLETQDLLAYLERYSADLAELAEASRRPDVRFPVRYEDGFAATMPQAGPLRQAARLLRLRAEARLERGMAVEAAQDVAAILRLAVIWKTEPTMIGQLVSKAIAGMGLQVIEIGLATTTWSEAELAVLDAELVRLDILGAGWRSFRTELAMGTAIIRFMAEDPRTAFGMIRSTESSEAPWPFGLFAWMPSGWYYQNIAHTGRVYLDDLFPAYDARARRVDFAKLQARSAEMIEKRASPYRFLGSMMMPSIVGLSSVFAAGQTQVDQARIAIALERWRREHGTYPAALAELPATAGVAGLHDLATGEPFHYRRNEDGTFLLYAVGADGVDNGGTPNKPGNAGLNQGDWVWSAR
jgi:hypothetical protein